MAIIEQREASADVEHVIARLLLVGTVAGVALIAIGVALMVVNGISPLAGTFPVFEPRTFVADLVAGRAQGFLWAGIVILIATPIARVVGELVTYAIRGDRILALAALAILGVIGLSVVAALALGG